MKAEQQMADRASLGRFKRVLLASGVLCCLALACAAPSFAAELPPYELDPQLSLTGDCSTSPFDPIPDPSCPYPAPPGGPKARFTEPRAVAIDPYGNEYVTSYADSDDSVTRLDVFDDEGRFVSEFAAPPAKNIAVDGKGNLYLFEDTGKVLGYQPSKYEPEDPGLGDIAYANPPILVTTGGTLAVDASNDHLIVAKNGGLTIFGSAAESNVVVDTVKDVGDWVESIALDPVRDRIYITFCEAGTSENCAVKVLSDTAPYTVEEEIDGSTTPAGKFASFFGRMSLAVDEKTGDLFVDDSINAKTIYRFNEDYEYVGQLKSNEFLSNVALQIAVSNGRRSPSAQPCKYPTKPLPPAGDACNRHFLFVPGFKASRRAIAFHPPGQTRPVIEDVSTAGIAATEAQLRATIDPRGLQTEYHFELTTLQAFEAEGFNGAATLGEGTIPAESLATEVSAFATGLVPGQAYRFRAVAENDLGGALENGANEATFATYKDAGVGGSACPNQALRLERSAALPDCRAYELVTPAETNGRSPKGVGTVGNLFPTVESSPDGGTVWFKIEGGSLPGSAGIGSFEGDPYVARRGSSGWSTELAGATGDEATVSIPASTSPDQGYAFWSARIEGPLVINGEETQYLYYPDGHSELIGRGSLGSDPKARGWLITEDGAHVIFETLNSTTQAIQLEPNAPANGVPALYDRTIDPETGAEETHVVSLLPGDETPTTGQNGSYRGASADGEGIAFQLGNTLYLRVGNQSTYKIGEGVDFAGVSEGGGRVFFLQGGNLEAFDVASEEVIDFSTTGDVTPVNVADGGARAYFVSPSVLGGANPEGDSAQAGKQNLYLSEEGAISFVATVTDRDVKGEPLPTPTDPLSDGLGLWTKTIARRPAEDPSRTNPDGSALLFQSRAEITGYPASASPQIYRYDSSGGRLQCISCTPTLTPAVGGARLQTITFNTLLAPPLTDSGFVASLTPDGKRAFFESSEALVQADTDGVQDVYEWEEEGTGSCEEPGGCVYLISSGHSARDNYLYAHSADGDDVFFTTGDVLDSADPGPTVSIYDARVNGGFPTAQRAGECLGEACQPAVSPPADPTPVLRGHGNPREQATGRARCPKGKRKVRSQGKVRCLKPKRAHHASKKGAKAKTQRGAAR
jgi:hypothetical protein